MMIFRMKTQIVFLLVLLYTEDVFGMTRAQLKKTLSIMKKQCMPKAGVTEDKVKNIEQGEFIEDRKVMCYIACVYKTIQVVKNEKIDRDLVFKQVDILYPADMKAAVKNAVEQCYGVQAKYNDLCEAAYYAAKCLYETDPPNFVFP
ncbi:hypothetical protein ABMA28_003779 [Loxostege sticticalis]|uniref:Uncharacterized protein n=1 Tax=Loxostege sticticalis TaxID=481309 RepID=A0ABD0ST01_LOXSC